MGKPKNVLFEDDIEKGQMHGWTENYVRVAAKYDPMLINSTKDVILNEINENGILEVKEADLTFEKH